MSEPDVCANCGRPYEAHFEETKCFPHGEGKWFPGSLADAIVKERQAQNIDVPNARTIVVQERAEGHTIPQGLSLTETGMANYIRYRFKDQIVSIRQPKDGRPFTVEFSGTISVEHV